jgi:phosphatidylglycerol lysyltransferase
MRTRSLEAREISFELKEQLVSVRRLWERRQGLPRLGFLTGLDPFVNADERRYYVAEDANARVRAFAVLTPVYARSGWLCEYLVRDPEAPNGTSELLVDAVMTSLKAETHYVTLGLAPLAGAVGWPLQLARRAATPLYDFEGLWGFKAKFRPRRWDSIYVAYPKHQLGALSLFDAMSAFSHGAPAKFGLRTMGRWLSRLARAPLR